MERTTLRPVYERYALRLLTPECSREFEAILNAKGVTFGRLKVRLD